MFTPQDPDFKQRVTSSFAEQQVMQTMQVSIDKIHPGEVRLTMPFQASLTQQNGYLHAGVITTIVDSAVGYAAYTLMPAKASVLSVEFKVNLMRPAIGDRFTAIGRVRKAGRTVSVVEGDLIAHREETEKLVATLSGTMMTVMPD